MIRGRFFSLVLALVVYFSTCVSVRGQSTYGSITGAVSDPSGAAVVGAQVILTNVGTGEKRTQPTVADGLYSFVNVIPGVYRIDIEQQGFKHFARQNVVVEVNQAG